jgi:heavy metal translocating P-type ATPase
MATPLAMIRGGGMAAERGILMRSAEAFQILKDVKKVILDKTGTITIGKPAVVEVEALGGHDTQQTLRLAAAAESPSEHPLARAVVAAAEAQHHQIPSATNFQAVPGKGVTARVDGYHITVGNQQFVEAAGIDLAPAHEKLTALQQAGHTVVVVAVDSQPAALIAIADQLKPDARQAIERMRGLGLEPVMLTGDNPRTARVVAEQVGIEEFYAQVLPQDKAAKVRELQRKGYRVAMVGDGINDAPALMQADVGIAIGAGTDIAIESADVVIIGERLGAVVDAYFIARASVRKTVQNLTLAFTFNGIGVPLAVTGLVHPVWAMVAMVASVSTVLTNSFGGRLLPKTRRGLRAQLTLKIANMHCEHCLASITKAVRKIDGVENVGGDPSRQVVTVTYREGMVEPDGIREAIVERGFQIGQDGVQDVAHRELAYGREKK